MQNVIFLAPPAAGKGTLSQYLVDCCGYKHISTGDLLRAVSKENTELGKQVNTLMMEGKFIGDEIILPLFKDELVKLKNQPFILDGMPRNIIQAKYLEDLFESLGVHNYVVINIAIDENLLQKRAVGRRICPSCKASYNIYFDDFKPKKENICNRCFHELELRGDDTEEVFKKRYEIYLENTLPLLEFYQNKNRLKNVDASKKQELIITDLLEILKGEK